MKFYIPRAEKIETAENIIKDALNKNTLNVGLFLEKFVMWWSEKGKLKCDPTIQISLLRKIKKSRNFIIRLTTSDAPDEKLKEEILRNERLSIPYNVLPIQHYNIYKKKYENFLTSLKQIYHVVSTEPPLMLNWRLVINLGAASVYETSLLFHRNYSIPYIPGSAFKGVTRYWSIQKFAEKLHESQNISFEKSINIINNALEKGEPLDINIDDVSFEDIIKIFGTQDKKGEIIFFDGLPIIEREKDIIVADIMNVHYREYYDKNEIPGDWMNPYPIFFLAVEGIKFRFSVASKNKDLAHKAMHLAKEAVNKCGIGAKTSAGYGYFKSK